METQPRFQKCMNLPIKTVEALRLLSSEYGSETAAMIAAVECLEKIKRPMKASA